MMKNFKVVTLTERRKIAILHFYAHNSVLYQNLKWEEILTLNILCDHSKLFKIFEKHLYLKMRNFQ